MAQFPNTNSILLREPRLLSPRRKPIGKVKIDWTHSLTKGLQSFTLLAGDSGSGRDLVANTPLSFNAQVATSILEHNQALEIARSGQDDCAFIQPRESFYQIDNTMTIVAKCKYNATTNYGPIVAVPYAASGWVSPWMSLSFGRNGTSTNGRLVIAQGGLFKSALSTASYLDLNTHTYAVIWNKTGANRAVFYRDGALYSQTTGTLSSEVVDWNTWNPIVFGNVSPDGQSSESNEIEEEYVMIFNRVLEERELKELHGDPYQFLSVK